MAIARIHPQIKQALINNGWTITHEPFRIQYAEVEVLADIAARRLSATQDTEYCIIVEVKSFQGRSFISELQKAIGQYLMYRHYLAQTDPEYSLYLGISEQVYYRFFQQQAVQLLLRANNIAVLVVNLERQEVLTWIHYKDTNS